jgi:hypothetical protein
LVVGWLCLGADCPLTAAAAPAESAPAASPGGFTFDLLPLQLDHARALETIPVKAQRSAFPKEPPISGRNIVRGSFQWGSRPEQTMPFIWDQGRGRLYLDLNRNQDLTDDAKGVFTSARGETYQSFTNVDLTVPTARGDRPVRLEMTLANGRGTSLRAYAGVCTWWQGRVSLHGKEWQFGLMESMFDERASGVPNFVFLRDWSERQRPVRLNYANPEGFDYTKNLVLGERAYGLDCRYVPDVGAPKYRVTFREQSPQLGELKVTGANLYRLILTEKRATTVILDKPEGVVKLPVGNYSLDEIWLREGDTVAGSFRAGRIIIEAKRTASLTAGGPLTNSVDVKSAAGSLELNYKLVGADGRSYQLPRPDYNHPPEYAVFQGTNRLATGKFQYG